MGPYILDGTAPLSFRGVAPNAAEVNRFTDLGSGQSEVEVSAFGNFVYEFPAFQGVRLVYQVQGTLVGSTVPEPTGWLAGVGLAWLI